MENEAKLDEAKAGAMLVMLVSHFAYPCSWNHIRRQQVFWRCAKKNRLGDERGVDVSRLTRRLLGVSPGE